MMERLRMDWLMEKVYFEVMIFILWVLGKKGRLMGMEF
jgi:hypothetical protein